MGVVNLHIGLPTSGDTPKFDRTNVKPKITQSHFDAVRDRRKSRRTGSVFGTTIVCLNATLRTIKKTYNRRRLPIASEPCANRVSIARIMQFGRVRRFSSRPEKRPCALGMGRGRWLCMKSGDVLAGKYRLLQRIGEGAMGEVWSGENLSTGQQGPRCAIFRWSSTRLSSAVWTAIGSDGMRIRRMWPRHWRMLCTR